MTGYDLWHFRGMFDSFDPMLMIICNNFNSPDRPILARCRNCLTHDHRQYTCIMKRKIRSLTSALCIPKVVIGTACLVWVWGLHAYNFLYWNYISALHWQKKEMSPFFHAVPRRIVSSLCRVELFCYIFSCQASCHWLEDDLSFFHVKLLVTI